jgi:hypothetical protein
MRKLLIMYMGDEAHQRFDDSSFRNEYEAISVDRGQSNLTLLPCSLLANAAELQMVWLWKKTTRGQDSFWSSPSPMLPRYSSCNIGQDVEQHHAKAKYCYEQAAEQSHAQAQKILVLCMVREMS